MSRRTATPADTGLHALFYAASTNDFDLLPEALRQQLVEQQSQAQLAHYRGAFSNLSIEIIELAGAPIGRLITAIDDQANEMAIVDLVVLPAHRGTGIASSLIGELQAQAAAASLAVHSTVRRDNVASRVLHERLGFKIAGEDEINYSFVYESIAGSASA